MTLFQTILFNFYTDFGKNFRFRARVRGKNLKKNKLILKKTSRSQKNYLGQKKNFSGKKKTFSGKKKKKNFIYRRESNLDEETNFTIKIFGKKQ